MFFDTLFFAALTPLLPHYAHALGLGKGGAGVLSAAYPAGALLGSIPSGIVAARFGVKRTVLVGLTIVAICTILFGIGDQAWELDLARFCQGVASAFSWTGALAWLVAASPAGRRGALIGQAFATAIAGALFGPVLGGIASVAGTGWTFGAVGIASFALVVLGCADALADRPSSRRGSRRSAGRSATAAILAGCWYVVLPSLLFGVVSVLGPLRLSHLGFGAIAIGATFLISAATEGPEQRLHRADRGPARPDGSRSAAGWPPRSWSARCCPWTHDRFVLAVLIVCAELTFGTLFTPAMTLLTQISEEVGLDYGYTFALISLAWAPGQTIGAAGGGALAHATSDAVPYLVLSAACVVTLAVLWPAGAGSLSGRP